MVLSCFQPTRPECNIESNVTTGRQKKIDCFSVDGICNHCNTVFEAMGCYFHYLPCQEARPSLTDNEITIGIKKENKTKCAKNISNRKATKLLKSGSASGGKYTELMQLLKNQFRANFSYQRPLSEERLMQETRSGKLFGYDQCDLKLPEHLKAYFANFPPVFRNTVVSRNDIGDLMEE